MSLSTRRPSPRSIVTRLAGGSLFAVLLAALFVLLLLPRVTHSTAMTVLTGSMTPAIPVGSVVMVRPVDPASLEVNDVATYSAPETEAFITHRIVDIDTRADRRWFVFKGDANNKRDIRPVPEDAIAGEVWFHLPYLGAIRDALKGTAGLSLLGMLVLGGYAVVQIGGALRERRDHRTSEPDSYDFDVSGPLVLVRLASCEQAALLTAETGGMILAASPAGCMVLLSPAAQELASVQAATLRYEALSSDVVTRGTVTFVVDGANCPPPPSVPAEVQHVPT